MNAKTISRLSSLFTFLLLLVTTNTFAQAREEFSSLFTVNQNQVQTNVVKSFEQKFKNATALNWYQTREDNVVVKYSQNAQTQYAVFSANGTLLRQFTYGTERNLPQEIKNVFLDKYWNVTIVNVANVKQDARNLWIIYAQKGNHSFAVKVEDGEAEEL
jgi:hypothetical protein